jgi:signal transduction histidine kinase
MAALIALLERVARRSTRSGPHRQQDTAESSAEFTERIDLGDLAVAQLVHDLRNDLSVITAFVEHLASRMPGGRADRDIAELRHRADRASQLSREILMAARPRTVARRPTDLNQLVASAADMLSRLAGDQVRVLLQLSDEPVPVVAELAELERILLNLALNARDAMAGAGVLTIETAVVGRPSPVGPEDARPKDCARLTVSDTGAGMSQVVESRMFQPFFTTKAQGTGLGLSSVAFTIRRLEGTVSVDSEPGRGTSVSVIFPLATGHPR